MNQGSRESSPIERARHLGVLFDLGHFVGAVEAWFVERVVPCESTSLVARQPHGSSASTPSGARVPALELSSLLRLDLPTRAWLLLSLPSVGAVALGVGRCLGVRAFNSRIPLPASLLKARTGAVQALFRLAPGSPAASSSRLGLVVDPLALCRDLEWSNSSSMLVMEAHARLESTK